MTVTDLITAWLEEAGEDALARQVRRKLAENEFGTLEVGVDTGPRAIRYVESWGHEHSFVSLRVERIEKRRDDDFEC